MPRARLRMGGPRRSGLPGGKDGAFEANPGGHIRKPAVMFRIF